MRVLALGGSAVRTFAGETATCALHERSLQERRASARRGSVSIQTLFADRVAPRTPAGLRQPLLVHSVRSLQDVRIATRKRAARAAGAARRTSYDRCGVRVEGCSGRTHNRESQRQPAVVRFAIANAFRRPTRSPHGWLTPAALEAEQRGEGSHVAVGFRSCPEGSFATAPERVFPRTWRQIAFVPMVQSKRNVVVGIATIVMAIAPN
jgi:hypothetical protein